MYIASRARWGSRSASVASSTADVERRRVSRDRRRRRRPVGVGELRAAAPPHRLDEVGVAVVDEIRERRGLAVLLAHEEHRRERRQQDRRSGEAVAWIVERGVGEHPCSRWRVADVVVVGVEHDETAVIDVVRGRTVAAIEAGRVLPRVDPPTLPGLGDIGRT